MRLFAIIYLAVLGIVFVAWPSSGAEESPRSSKRTESATSSGKDILIWKSDEYPDVVCSTDDPNRIPEKYRSKAFIFGRERGLERWTKSDDAAQRKSMERRRREALKMPIEVPVEDQTF